MTLTLQRAAHRLVGPLLERWLASATDRLGRLPTPNDEPRVFANGPDAIRILLMGGGVVRGHGVTSHDLGLGGHLARRVSALTGRGTEVDIQWRPMMSPETGAELLDQFELDLFDAVVVILGSREAVSLMPVRDWRSKLYSVLDAVRRSAPPDLPVFIVGIPQMPDFLTMPFGIRAIVVRRTDQLNAATEQFALSSGRLGYLPISVAGGSLRNYGDRQTYDRWASQIAPTIAKALGSTRAPRGSGRTPARVDEEERRRALHRMHVTVATPDERLDRITQTAHNLLGGTAAALSFIDDEGPLLKSRRGGTNRSAERTVSFTAATIMEPRAFVIAGDELLERFGDNPWVAGSDGVRFYAGYPIETPDGYRVGALAVVGSQPRVFTAEDESLLRELAGRAQAVLWGDARV